jgi:hypothetical protein
MWPFSSEENDADEQDDEEHRIVVRNLDNQQHAQRPDAIDPEEWQFESREAAPDEQQFEFRWKSDLDAGKEYILAPVNEAGNYVDFDRVVWQYEVERSEFDKRLARLEEEVEDPRASRQKRSLKYRLTRAMVDGEVDVETVEKIAMVTQTFEADSSPNKLEEADLSDPQEVGVAALADFVDNYNSLGDLSEDLNRGLTVAKDGSTGE